MPYYISFVFATIQEQHSLIPALNNASVTVRCQTWTGAGDYFGAGGPCWQRLGRNADEVFISVTLDFKAPSRQPLSFYRNTQKRYHQWLWIPTQTVKIVLFTPIKAVDKNLKAVFVFFHKVLNLAWKKKRQQWSLCHCVICVGEKTAMKCTILWLSLVDWLIYKATAFVCSHWNTGPDTQS